LSSFSSETKRISLIGDIAQQRDKWALSHSHFLTEELFSQTKSCESHSRIKTEQLTQV
jgi:hypothetical protein